MSIFDENVVKKVKKNSKLSKKEVSKDTDLMLWTGKLSGIYRFTHQRFWEKETTEHDYAMRIEGYDNKGNKVPRAESVSEHSWHLCIIATIIAPRFNELSLEKCLLYATLHDILEIITDDKNPIGKNGLGTKTHAFNLQKKQVKDQLEYDALSSYLSKVSKPSHDIQKVALEDFLLQNSAESKFIKAIDKIHPLIYILKKKKGNITDEHLNFTIRYAGSCKEIFPAIEPYYNELVKRILKEVGVFRGVMYSTLEKKFQLNQMSLFEKKD